LSNLSAKPGFILGVAARGFSGLPPLHTPEVKTQKNSDKERIVLILKQNGIFRNGNNVNLVAV